MNSLSSLSSSSQNNSIDTPQELSSDLQNKQTAKKTSDRNFKEPPSRNHSTVKDSEVSAQKDSHELTPSKYSLNLPNGGRLPLSKETLRQGIAIQEILGKPLALRKYRKF